MIEHLVLLTGTVSIAFGLFLGADQLLSRSSETRRSHYGLLYSAVFGLMAAACIEYGHEVRPGVIIDARGAVVAVATTTGGAGVGAVTLLAAWLSRWTVGGSGMWAGLGGLALDYLAVYVLVRVWRPRSSTWRNRFSFLCLCGVATGVSEAWSLRWVPPAATGAALFQTAGADLFLTQWLATLLLGGLIQLQQERSRTRAIFEAALATSMDGFALLGEDGRLQECNPRLEELTGYSRSELLQLDLSQLEVGLSRLEATQRLAEVKTRGPRRTEFRWRRRDGRELQVEVAAAAAPAAVGGVYAFVRDLTEPKARQAELERIYGLVPDMICECDLAGRFTKLNPTWERILGYPPEEMLGRPYTDFIHPDDAATTQTQVAAQLAGHRTFGFINRYRHKRGQWIWLEWSACLASDLGVFVGVARDITQRREADLLLQASERRYRLVAESSSDVIWLYNLATESFEYVSPAVERVRGYSAEETMRQSLAETMTSESFQHIQRLLAERQAAFAAGDLSARVRTTEVLHTCRDGTVVPAETVTTLVTDELGRVTHLQGVSREIRERKKAEGELHRLNRALLTRSACDKVLIHAAAEEEFLEQVCRLLVEAGGYRFAWVGYPESDEAKSVRAVAQSGYEDNYLAPAGISWGDNERGRGPTGLCLRSRQAVVVREIANDPAMALWREAALRQGYAASAAFPLIHGERLFGALMVYAAATNAFEPGEVALLSALADDLAFGIATQRTREARERAERALREQEGLLRSILDNIPDPTWMKDLNGRFLAVNKAWCNFTGFSREQSVGRNDSELFPPEVVARFQEQERTVAQARQAQYWEEAVAGARGGTRWFETYKAPLIDEEGQIRRTIGIAREITQRKRTELDLEESRRGLATLLSNLPGMAYRRRNDRAWTLEFASAGCRDLTGYTTADLVGDTQVHYVELIHAEDRDRVRTQVQNALEKRQSYELVYRICGRDGDLKWVWEQGRGVYTAHGEVTALEGFVLDVTSQKTAEATLAKYQLLSDHANDIILFLYPRNGQIVEANRAACEAYGYSRAELLTKTIYDLRHDEPGKVAQQLRDASGTGILFEAWHQRQDGSVFPVEVSSRAAQLGTETLLLSVVRDLTARKQAEQALTRLNAELEQRVRERTAEALDLYNNAPCGYHSLGPDARILQMNDTELSWLGYAREEVLGKLSLIDLMTSESAERFRTLYGPFVAEGTTLSVESEVRRKDGTTLTVLQNGTAVRGPDQGLLRTLSTVIDISERKRLEGFLRESELQYRVLFESSRDAVITTDTQGRCLDCNPAAVSMFGCPDKQTLLGLGLVALSPVTQPDGRDSRAIYPEVVAQCLAKGSLFLGWQHQRLDGQLFFAEIALSVVEVHGAHILHGLVRDVTRRKEAEAKLRKLSQAVEYSPLMILITDRVGQVEYVNPAWEQVTGYRLEEVIGQKPRALKSGVHGPAFYAHLWGEISAGRVWRGEFCNRRRNGELYWESAAIAPVQDDAGGITHYVAVKEDITERRRVAEELRQAKEAADLANRAKSAFLANMSHEIRTPMNAILGFSQLLLRDASLSDSQRQQLTTITHSGEHLLSIISDILEMARIESGRLTLNPVDFDLWLMLDGVEQLFRPRTQAKNLDFRVERPGGGPCFVHGDETRLRQIIINLLGNAVKFTPHQGSIVLRARLTDESEGKVLLCVEVEDTGTGIDSADMPHLFEPFFQTQTGRQVAGGTGLGLPISREFARLMGGDITVHSELGHGSVFQLFARVGQCQPADPGVQAAAAPRPLHLVPGLAACRVLVVDDQTENRELLEQLLAPIGFEVRVASGGSDALAVCQNWRPHLVLLDLRMPGMDGYEVARRLRAEYGAAVRILALSASVFAQDAQRALDAGADTFVGKPFRDTDLLEKIKQLSGVDYVYGPALVLGSAPSVLAEETLPSPEEVKLAPAALVSALREATRRAEYDRMLEVVEQIGAQDERLANRLRQLVVRFDYTTLQRVLS